ncbi:MAG: hypothetical protein ACREFP_13350 [Acetobacteraceae bacterium]
MIRTDGSIEGYDKARTFDIFQQPVANLPSLGRLLAVLLHRADCCVVRGLPIDLQRCSRVRRMVYADLKSGEAPTLQESPHRWAGLDIDGIDRPDAVAAADLSGCAAIAIARLPASFRGARAIVQASASHGIKPGIRLRLWFWLSRPTTGAELKRWLRGTPVDSCLFRPAQICYTAAPIFERPLRDHLPTRIAEMPGAETVEVPSAEALQPPPPRPAKPLPHPTDTRANSYSWAALRNAAARITTAAIGQRHFSILTEAQGLARFADAGLLSHADVRSTLMAAARDAGKPADEAESAISWGIAHPRTDALPEAVR